MKKSKLLLIITLLFVNFCNIYPTAYAQVNSLVEIRASVLPSDATNFQSTPNYNPGEGNCELTWISSATPNIINQLLEIEGPQGPGINFTTIDLPFLGSSMPDSEVVINLVIGETYTFQLISEGTVNSSNGVWTTCVPTAALPSPILTAEPATTIGTSNILYWTNGDATDGVDDIVGAGLQCQITASLTDLDNDPFGAPLSQSGWIPCDDDAVIYEYTFTSLPTNQTIYYHVQSRNTVIVPPGLPSLGMSAYSNVEDSVQYSGGGGGGGSNPYCGDGLVNTANEECDDGNNVFGDGCDLACKLEVGVCGNNKIEAGEECDDGNILNGDGCSSICENEEVIRVTFNLKGKPEYRTAMATHPNLGLNASLLFYKPATGSLTGDNVVLDNYGDGTYTAEIVTGTYDIGLNGEAHNTKIIRGVEITDTTGVVDLDFTVADTWELTAGDTVDNNKVDALDMAKLIAGYKATGGVNDLNKAGGVNALDIAIILWNYKLEGDPFGGAAA